MTVAAPLGILLCAKNVLSDIMLGLLGNSTKRSAMSKQKMEQTQTANRLMDELNGRHRAEQEGILGGKSVATGKIDSQTMSLLQLLQDSHANEKAQLERQIQEIQDQTAQEETELENEQTMLETQKQAQEAIIEPLEKMVQNNIKKEYSFRCFA